MKISVERALEIARNLEHPQSLVTSDFAVIALAKEVQRLNLQSKVDLELCRSISEARDVLTAELDRREQTIKLLHAETKLNIDKRQVADLQNRELREELQHQKELWVVALPQLHALDDRAGIIRFGQLHDPQGSIDKTLAQKPFPVEGQPGEACGPCGVAHPGVSEKQVEEDRCGACGEVGSGCKCTMGR